MQSGPRIGRWARGIAALAVVAVLAAACGSDDDNKSAASTDTTSTSTKPYNVSVAFPGEIVSLDPQKIQDVPARTIFANIFEPLIRFTADGKKFEPVLASALPKKVDDTTWEVTLRTDPTFSSGKKLTADDVVYSYQRILDPSFDTQQRDLIETITSVEAVDAKTVRFKTKEPDPLFEARITYVLILPKGQADVAGFPEQGLDGTGPYKFLKHTPNVSVVIEKRTDYWNGDLKGSPQQFSYKVVPDEAARLAGLETGEIDIVPSIAPEQTSQVPQSETILSTETAFLRTDTLKAPFSDPKLREAASLAIDTKSIVKQLYQDEAKVATCQIAAPGVFGHTDGMKPSAYDPAKAKSLVQANYHGEKITFYAIKGRFAKHEEVAQTIQQELQTAGFDVDLVFPTSTDQLVQQFGAGPKSGFVDLLLYQSNTEFLDIAKQLQWLDSNGLYSAINDPKIDELVKTGGTTFDRSVRQSAYDDMNKLACDNVYNIYLFTAPNVYGMSDRVQWKPRLDDLILLGDVQSKS